MKNPTVASRYWGSGAAHLSPAGPMYPMAPRSTSRGECQPKTKSSMELRYSGCPRRTETRQKKQRKAALYIEPGSARPGENASKQGEGKAGKVPKIEARAKMLKNEKRRENMLGEKKKNEDDKQFKAEVG